MTLIHTIQMSDLVVKYVYCCSVIAMQAIVLSVLDDSVETEPTRKTIFPTDSDEQRRARIVLIGPTGRAAEDS